VSSPTLEEVAAVAGVSRATVSRVINDSPKVSPAVRATVEAAIAQLGYVPNRAARSLVTRRTDSIGLVVSEPEALVFSDPFFAGIVRGVSGALADTSMQLVLVIAQTAGQRKKLEQYVLNGHVDGVLLVSLHGDDPLPAGLAAAGVPAVLVGRPVRDVPLTWVDADNRGGATAAVRHLLGQGRRRIATITGPQDMSAGVDRLDGYRDALPGPDAALIEIGDFSEESGVRAMTALLDREPGLDAVFAASDLMAAGALRALRAAGRGVPDEVAVIGFDDSIIARQTDPALTTVRQPVNELGREVTRRLLEMIGTGDAPAPGLVLPTELVVRGSA
jgi:DNA-binding LacI/PurR family transcriptional regulator